MCLPISALVRALKEMGAGRLRVMADGAVRLLDPPPDREALVCDLVARDLVPTTIAEEGQSLEEYFLAVIGSEPPAQETARRGTRTATTRSEPREEETRVQSAAR